MWLILGVFSGTYLLRAIVDLSTDPSYQNFTSMLSALTVGILNDFFALMLILVLHYGNFSESNQKERLRDSFAGMSEDNDEREVSVIFSLDSNPSESQRNSLNIEDSSELSDQNIIAHSPDSRETKS